MLRNILRYLSEILDLVIHAQPHRTIKSIFSLRLLNENFFFCPDYAKALLFFTPTALQGALFFQKKNPTRESSSCGLNQEFLVSAALLLYE